MSPTRSPTTDRSTTKLRLLETAVNLIWTSSYTAVGVNEICKEAGVTKGSFYHHFESKAALFVAATRHHWESMRHELDALFSPSVDGLVQLENLFAFIVAQQEMSPLHSAENPVTGCPLFTSGAQASAEEQHVRDAAREMSEHILCYNAALVRQLDAGGYLRSPADPLLMASLMAEFIQGVLLWGRVHADLGMVNTHLREGLYRMLDIKPEFRKRA